MLGDVWSVGCGGVFVVQKAAKSLVDALMRFNMDVQSLTMPPFASITLHRWGFASCCYLRKQSEHTHIKKGGGHMSYTFQATDEQYAYLLAYTKGTGETPEAFFQLWVQGIIDWMEACRK
jgi:hypothetical protein